MFDLMKSYCVFNPILLVTLFVMILLIIEWKFISITALIYTLTEYNKYIIVTVEILLKPKGLMPRTTFSVTRAYHLCVVCVFRTAYTLFT